MSRETDVLRLDYEKTPPGYRVGRKGFSLCAQDGEHLRIVTRIASSAAEALSAAWTHYKREYDPPGMQSSWDDEPFAYVHFGGRVVAAEDGGHDPASTARAAAWAWYDSRHALSLREEALGLGAYLVPFAEYLALTDVAVDVSNQCCEPLELDGGRPLELSDVRAVFLLLSHGGAV